MTKALVTIEVDIETPAYRQSGLGESSHPSHPGIKFLEDEKRNSIWDQTHNWLKDKNGFVQIIKVTLTKAGA